MAAAAYGELKFYGSESNEDLTNQILEDIDVVESASYLGQSEDDAPILQIVFTEEGEEALLDAVGSASTYYLKATCGLDKDGEEITVLNLQFDKQYLIDRAITITVGSGSIQQTKQMAMQLTEGGIAGVTGEIPSIGQSVAGGNHGLADLLAKSADAAVEVL